MTNPTATSQHMAAFTYDVGDSTNGAPSAVADCERVLQYFDRVKLKISSLSNVLKLKQSSAKQKVEEQCQMLQTKIKDFEERIIGDIAQSSRSNEEKILNFLSKAEEEIGRVRAYQQALDAHTPEAVTLQVEVKGALRISSEQISQAAKELFELVQLEYVTKPTATDLMQSGQLGYMRLTSQYPHDISLQMLSDGNTSQMLRCGCPITILCQVKGEPSQTAVLSQMSSKLTKENGNHNVPFQFGISGGHIVLYFTPDEEGKYKVSVTLYGEEVSNSPLLLNVGPRAAITEGIGPTDPASISSSERFVPPAKTAPATAQMTTPFVDAQVLSSSRPKTPQLVSASSLPSLISTRQPAVIVQHDLKGAAIARRPTPVLATMPVIEQALAGIRLSKSNTKEPEFVNEPFAMPFTTSGAGSKISSNAPPGFEAVPSSDTLYSSPAAAISVPQSSCVVSAFVDERCDVSSIHLGRRLQQPSSMQRHPSNSVKSSVEDHKCVDDTQHITQKGIISERTHIASSGDPSNLTEQKHNASAVVVGVDAPQRPNVMRWMKSVGDETVLRADFVLRLGKMNVNEPEKEAFHLPIGCTKNEVTQKYIVCDTGHQGVKIFNLEGALESILMNSEETPFHRPSAVVCLQDGSFCIKDDKSVQHFARDGTFISRFDTLADTKRYRNLYGLVMNPSGNLLTLELPPKGGHNAALVELDPYTGRLVQKFPFACIPKDLLATSKCRFMDLYGDRLVVADLGASVAYISNCLGEPLGTFGQLGHHPGCLKEPSGVTIDGAGNILLGDSRNDRVQVYHLDGTFAGTVRFFGSPIKRPSDIHLTCDGHLIVNNYIQHNVAIYKLQP